ncbi:MAG: hypothetical protein KTR25_10260 [Myxococcales bacterium]|nr:hypothetical protein [Myxococcales bacterium]
MEGLDRLRLSSVVCALFIPSVPRKRYFADHPSHCSDGLLVIRWTPNPWVVGHGPTLPTG